MNKNIRVIMNSLLSIGLAFTLGGVFIFASGENPFATYWVLLSRSLLNPTGLMNTIHAATPLILTGLAIAVTFKARIYNMGVEGQMLLGGFFAGIIGAYLPVMNSFLLKSLAIVTAVVCGMLFALIPAILKVKFKVNELVVTLMLNYVVLSVLEFLATGVFRDYDSGFVATPTISQAAMFVRFGRTRLTAFTLITLLVLIGMFIMFRYSKFGYEIKAFGKNPEFAEASGMRMGRKIIYMMLLSGGLAGLAGAGVMLSDQFKFTLGFSGTPGIGWDGMLVSLLGAHSPIGILIAAIFYASLKTGSDHINMFTNVPSEIISLIQGLIILFLAVHFMNKRTSFIKKWKSRKEVKPSCN